MATYAAAQSAAIAALLAKRTTPTPRPFRLSVEQRAFLDREATLPFGNVALMLETAHRAHHHLERERCHGRLYRDGRSKLLIDVEWEVFRDANLAEAWAEWNGEPVRRVAA